MNEKIISTLVGLTGACSNNAKTQNTDAIVMNAILNLYSDINEDTIASEIRKDKFTISPNCKTCPTPCGNTSDYDMEKFHNNQELKPIKEQLLRETYNLATRISASDTSAIPAEIYRAISYFGYELAEASYTELINTLKQMEV